MPSNYSKSSPARLFPSFGYIRTDCSFFIESAKLLLFHLNDQSLHQIQKLLVHHLFTDSKSQ